MLLSTITYHMPVLDSHHPLRAIQITLAWDLFAATKEVVPPRTRATRIKIAMYLHRSTTVGGASITMLSPVWTWSLHTANLGNTAGGHYKVLSQISRQKDQTLITEWEAMIQCIQQSSRSQSGDMKIFISIISMTFPLSDLRTLDKIIAKYFDWVRTQKKILLHTNFTCGLPVGDSFSRSALVSLHKRGRSWW
jgi:hypothetical protein